MGYRKWYEHWVNNFTKKKHLNTYNESEIILTILKCIPTHRIKYGSQIGPFG